MISPKGKYYSEIQRRIADARCRPRKGSVRFVDALISAVVHMDEKTPHMHLVFVPLTSDNRLSAKDNIGNRKQLIAWQDDFWKHMSQHYPQLERGESSNKTGRTHILTRLFKEMVRLNGMRDKLMDLLTEVTSFNKGKKVVEIEKFLKHYIPGVEQIRIKLKKYDGAFKRNETGERGFAQAAG